MERSSCWSHIFGYTLRIAYSVSVFPQKILHILVDSGFMLHIFQAMAKLQRKDKNKALTVNPAMTWYTGMAQCVMVLCNIFIACRSYVCIFYFKKNSLIFSSKLRTCMSSPCFSPKNKFLLLFSKHRKLFLVSFKHIGNSCYEGYIHNLKWYFLMFHQAHKNWMRTPSECFFLVVELSSPCSLLTMRIRSINPSILSWPSFLNTGHNTTPNNEIMSNRIRIHINYQFFYLNMAKSVTQIFVLWLVLVVWYCQAEDAAAVPLPPAAAKPALSSWVSNLHSFAAGGSYISLSSWSSSFACCHIRVPS